MGRCPANDSLGDMFMNYQMGIQSMRVLFFCLGILLAMPATLPLSAAELAVPASVKDVAKIRPGRLVQVSGYVRVSSQGDFQLESPENGRKVALDFSRSAITPQANGLDQAGSGAVIPIEVVGRVGSANGTGAIVVIGYTRLTSAF